MIFDFPTVKFQKGVLNFLNGKIISLPSDYKKTHNQSNLDEFYTNLLNTKQEKIEYGEDPLGFFFLKYDFICYIGLVCTCTKKSLGNRLKKKFPDNRFTLKYLSYRINEDHKLANYKELIPIDIITQNLHELRGLNAKVTDNVDSLLGFNSESEWEATFDNADINLKKIYVASRLTKFILDNTKFYDPKFWETLKIKRGRFFAVHGSVNKIVKIYRNDFKLEKPDLDFKGHSYRKLEGEKQYFEVLIKILVENAYKYSPFNKLGPKISIQEKEKTISIQASSYGHIIPKQDRIHLFTKGFRSGVNKTKAEGTGIGLYNAQRLTEKFDGTLIYSCEVLSTENEIEIGWNTFTLEFKNTHEGNKKNLHNNG
jgi:hypothetical protein